MPSSMTNPDAEALIARWGETVAKAIYDATHAGLRNCYAWDEAWEPHQELGRERYRKEAAAAISALLPAIEGEWFPIETAPYDTTLEVRVGSMTFLARLQPDAAEDENGSCDQWQAAVEGEHPSCWSEGACWESNIDECQSLQPTGWRPLPSPPRGDA